MNLRIALLAGALLGCSASVPPQTEVADGKSVVEAALTAWRNAEAVQTLRDAKDGTLVADPQWEQGWKLNSFQIVDQTADGFQARCKVQLSLTDPKGKSVNESAEYLATSAPKRTVTRVSEGW
jgi:hypothetical protein